MPEKERLEIDDVIRKIKGIDSFHKLDPSYFAPLEGAAHVVAKSQEKMEITQLRKLFAEIKRLERMVKGKNEHDKLKDIPNFYTELWLLHPELAYAKGRGLVDEKFFTLMRLSLSEEKLNTVADFKRFAEFITAIMAYKKYEKGK